MPATPTAETGGHQSLLTDPAAPREEPAPDAPTRVLREVEQPTPAQPSADPNAHTLFGAPAPEPAYGPAPAPVYGPPRNPDVPAPFAGPVPPGVPVEPVADLPAGLDPDELAAAPGTSARRGKLRRRITFLRAARELLLRDLGGFVYELHRTAHDVEHEAHRRLRETKLARLSRVDAELHELELRLDDVRRQVLVREPGVGGECSHCGELYASAAHYCSNCGNPLTESARRELAKAQAPVAETAATPAEEPAPPVPVDQPTQELGPLDRDQPNAEADFEWPAREAAATSGVDLRKRGSEEPADGEAAPVGETGADVPAQDEATPADPSASLAKETPAAGAETPATDAPGEEPAPADGVPVGETGGETRADAPSGEADPHGTRNGSARDDSILRPVERRQ